jgi:uncharacterized peroxidase-related enzyme
LLAFNRREDPLNTPEPAILETNISLVDEEAATGAVAEAYADYRARFGREHVPGILKCFATHPPLLKQMIELASSLLFAESLLTRTTKEMIATYVSRLNACAYCLDSHANSLYQSGGSDELLLAIFQEDLESPSISPEERVLLVFTAKVTEESYKVSATDIQSLQKAGWHEQQIAEAIHIASLFACFNRVANAFGLSSQNLFSLTLSQLHTEDHA